MTQSLTPQKVFRVVVVEDNPHVADLISDGLDGAAKREFGGAVGFVFEVFHDGREALKALDSLHPHLIILDIYMPVMDGAAFLRHVRAHPTLGRTPVIAVSAGGPGAQEMALAAGADLFLDKPVRLNQLLKAANEVLRKH